MKLYYNGKNQLIPLVHSWDTVSLRVQRPDWPYQQAKNESVSSICSGETVHLEILLSDWVRAFWPISQEQDVSQI